MFCSVLVADIIRGANAGSSFEQLHLQNSAKGTSAPTNVLKDRDAKALAAHVVRHSGGDLEALLE